MVPINSQPDYDRSHGRRVLIMGRTVKNFLGPTEKIGTTRRVVAASVLFAEVRLSLLPSSDSSSSGKPLAKLKQNTYILFFDSNNY